MLSDVNPGMRRMPNLAPLTEKQMRDAERDKVYVFNVSPKEHVAFVGKQYVVPAREKGSRVSEPLVIPGVVYTTGLKKAVGLYCEYEWIARDGIEIAQEIVGTFPMLDPSQNMTPYGLFYSDSPEASKEAIDKATAAWLETCSRKVAEGDRLAAINGGIVDIGQGRTASNIAKDHIQACEELGLKRPWTGTNKQMMLCDECGESNMPTAARCKNAECRCIFDEAKCRQRFPEMFAHEEVKRGVGRPPKSEAA
jgi:hypothetical protein